MSNKSADHGVESAHEEPTRRELTVDQASPVDTDPTAALSVGSEAEPGLGTDLPFDVDEVSPEPPRQRVARRDGPVVLRRQIGNALRRLRQEANLTIEQAAYLVSWSPTKVTLIERGQTPIKRPVEIGEWARAYGADERTAAELQRMAERSKQPAWWTPWSKMLPGDVEMSVGLEQAATELLIFCQGVVPALLQTEAYARAAISGAGLTASAEQIEQLAEMRVMRQQVLDGDDPVRAWVILDEAALYRAVGGPTVLRDQLRRLLELGDRRNITLQLLPFSAGAHPGLDGSFTILRAPGGGGDVCHVESNGGNLCLEKTDDVRRLQLAFDTLRAQSCDVRTTRLRIADRLAQTPAANQ
jgi:hypothetical protein